MRKHNSLLVCLVWNRRTITYGWTLCFPYYLHNSVFCIQSSADASNELLDRLFFYQSENTEVPAKTLHLMGWILVRILGMLGFQSLRTCAKANGSKSLLLRLARTKWFEQCSPKIKGKNKSEEKCVLLSALLKGEAEIPTGECPSTAYTWRAQENLPLRRSSRSPIWSPRFRWDAL